MMSILEAWRLATEGKPSMSPPPPGFSEKNKTINLYINKGNIPNIDNGRIMNTVASPVFQCRDCPCLAALQIEKNRWLKYDLVQNYGKNDRLFMKWMKSKNSLWLLSGHFNQRFGNRPCHNQVYSTVADTGAQRKLLVCGF
jgi:hypothetical protein